jgi:predicted metalloprotease with PDZ domain
MQFIAGDRFMKTLAPAISLAALCCSAQVHGPITYHLRYSESTAAIVSVTLTTPQPMKAPLSFVMPRGYPGGYGQMAYDSFVIGLSAIAPDVKQLHSVKDEYGPRWNLGKAGDSVQRIEYQIDVGRMEAQILDAVSTSKVRKGYVGLLGYSIFGYVDGLEDRKTQLRVQGPEGWPILSTLSPALPAARTAASSTSPDYYALADSQVLMGPDLHVERLDGKIPLVMAVYAEGDLDHQLVARLAREALDAVQGYFGDAPIPQYTVQLELLRPLPNHSYNFSQEHIDSGTFSLSVESSITGQSPAQSVSRMKFNFAHHMAHSWLPKLAYGVGYRPFTWEMTPVIDTIWFNEGFGRYAAIAAMADAMPAAEGKEFRDRQLASLRATVDSAAPFIRRMPLPLLSREASFLYMTDFRTGRNVFSRGALMAAEMDDFIRSQTQGKQSLRDALRWLLRWSAENRKPFQTADLPRYFQTATGVPVSDILDRWMKPLE